MKTSLHGRALRVLPYLLLAASFAFAAWAGWDRWGDLWGEADQALAARLAAHPPDYVFRGRQNLSEFGVRAFGAGYAEATDRFIGRLYVPVDSAGLGVLLRLAAPGRVPVRGSWP